MQRFKRHSGPICKMFSNEGKFAYQIDPRRFLAKDEMMEQGMMINLEILMTKWS
jgi:hypothetical protein